MAWSDEPTDAQLSTLFRWIEWHMPPREASYAVKWLKIHATRKEVSDEMSRVKKLYDEHKLSKEECFNSSIWDGYKFDESYEMSETRLVVDDGKGN